jgi:hypothetical protein
MARLFHQLFCDSLVCCNDSSSCSSSFILCCLQGLAVQHSLNAGPCCCCCCCFVAGCQHHKLLLLVDGERGGVEHQALTAHLQAKIDIHKPHPFKLLLELIVLHIKGQ